MPNLVLTTPTNPGNASWQDIAALVPPGVVIIPAGGSISGTYQSGVLCLGNVTITGATTVDYDMIVLGNVLETTAYPLTVYGDLLVQGNIDFSAVGTVQQNVNVYGDCVCANINIPQQGGSVSQFNVRGDLTVWDSVFIMASTEEATGGGVVSVSGNMVAPQVFLGGIDYSPSGLAGNGGTLAIGGNARVAYVDVSGGDRLTAGLNGGSGGIIFCPGNFVCPSILALGRAGPNNGGNGGVVNLGSLTGGFINANGAECYSADPLHAAGQGGTINVAGNATLYLDINASGGNRIGTLSGSNAGPGANGGSVTVLGDLVVNNILVAGGDVNVDAECQSAGNGGVVQVTGNLCCNNVDASGGNSNSLGCGNGGSLLVSGALSARYLNANLSNILLYGGSTIPPLGPVVYLNAGNGGTLTVEGTCSVFYVTVSGGSVNNSDTRGNGGASGNVLVRGSAYIYVLQAYGGNCSSADSTHGPGSGGLAEFIANVFIETCSLTGGNRYGSILAPGVSAASGTGGTLNVYASYGGYTFSSYGGDVDPGLVGYQSATPPNGGTFYVNGNCNLLSGIFCYGGNTTSGNGGAGGTIQINGAVEGQNVGLSVSGGNSTAATGGVGGSILLYSGAKCRLINLLNGTGGAPGAGSILQLGGACNINEVQMSTNGQLQPFTNSSTMLRLQQMSPKNTLNNTAGVATPSQAANFATNLYINTPAGAWYRVAGVVA